MFKSVQNLTVLPVQYWTYSALPLRLAKHYTVRAIMSPAAAFTRHSTPSSVPPDRELDDLVHKLSPKQLSAIKTAIRLMLSETDSPPAA